MLLSCLGAMACIAVSWRIWGDVFEMRGVTRFSVRVAEDTWREDGDIRERVGAGSGVGAGAKLVVGDGGSATFEYHDDNAKEPQPAALITMEGGTLSLRDGYPLLHEGAMGVAAHRAMVMTLADGTRVELGAGQYRIDAVELESLDRLLAEAAELGVSVEVVDGEPAKITRPDQLGERTIAVGQVGRFSGSPGIALEGPSPTEPTTFAGPGSRQPTRPEPDLIASVVDPYGPLADSSVQLLYRHSGHQTTASLFTDSFGEFVLGPGSGLQGKFVVAQVSPPPHRSDLGVTAPNAYAIEPVGGGYELRRPLGLSTSREMVGRVTDRGQQPLGGVRVLPCLYDELLGLILPWFEVRHSDNNGRFTMVRLPAGLPPHQRLALIALHPDYEPVFQPIPLPNSPAADVLQLQIELPELRTVTLSGLPPGVEVLLFEEVLGLPGLAARRRLVTVQSTGRVPGLRFGSGQLWMGSSGDRLRPLRPSGVANAAVGIELQLTAEPARPFGVVFRDLVAVDRTDVLLAHGFRHERFRRVQGIPSNLFVMEFGMRAAQTHVFALSAASSGGVAARFLGIQTADMRQRFEVDLGAGEVELLAVSALNGRLAYADLRGSGRRAGLPTMSLQLLGRAQLGVMARPPGEPLLPLRFEPTEDGPLGSRPVLYRFATARAGWMVTGLPQGDYLVTDNRGRSWSVTIDLHTAQLL